MNIYGKQQATKNLIPKDFVVLSAKLEINPSDVAISLADKTPKLKLNEIKNAIDLVNENVCFILNKTTGSCSSYNIQAKQLVEKAPYLNFWRDSTDNDYVNKMPERSEAWRIASEEQTLKTISVAKISKGSYKVNAEFSLENRMIDLLVSSGYENVKIHDEKVLLQRVKDIIASFLLMMKMGKNTNKLSMEILFIVLITLKK